MPSIGADRLAAVRGLLYVAYHATAELTSRQDQCRAIWDHLQHHTYRFTNSAGERRMYDIKKFRALAGEIFLYHFRPGSHHASTMFFLLKSHGLLWRVSKYYQIELRTPSLSDLPPHSYSTEEFEQTSTSGHRTVQDLRSIKGGMRLVSTLVRTCCSL